MTHLLVECRQTMFYTHILKVYINFKCKKKPLKKITKINDIIPLRMYNSSHKLAYVCFLFV